MLLILLMILNSCISEPTTAVRKPPDSMKALAEGLSDGYAASKTLVSEKATLPEEISALRDPETEGIDALFSGNKIPWEAKARIAAFLERGKAGAKLRSLFEIYVEREPQDHWALAMLSGILLEAGDLAGAKARIEEAIVAGNTESWYWERKARIEFELKDWIHAADSASRAIELDPESAASYSLRAFAAMKGGTGSTDSILYDLELAERCFGASGNTQAAHAMRAEIGKYAFPTDPERPSPLIEKLNGFHVIYFSAFDDPAMPEWDTQRGPISPEAGKS
jgi:tetratricopeptide (TPR) repeat protein